MMRTLRDQRGFTLLEVMIAFAILAFILAAVFIAQGTSLASSGRSRNIIIATNLAKNLVAEKELLYEGRPFDRIEPKQDGAFPAPYDKYKWKIEITEVEFGALTDLLLKANQNDSQLGGEQGGQVLKMFETYLKKSVRRMNLVVEYPDGPGTSTLTFTELLVNYDQEFAGGM